jgi:uncharacterized protein YdiU (UPF0061 family)
VGEKIAAYEYALGSSYDSLRARAMGVSGLSLEDVQVIITDIQSLLQKGTADERKKLVELKELEAKVKKTEKDRARIKEIIEDLNALALVKRWGRGSIGLTVSIKGGNGIPAYFEDPYLFALFQTRRAVMHQMRELNSNITERRTRLSEFAFKEGFLTGIGRWAEMGYTNTKDSLVGLAEWWWGSVSGAVTGLKDLPGDIVTIFRGVK